jgi:hypothetical protein
MEKKIIVIAANISKDGMYSEGIRLDITTEGT